MLECNHIYFPDSCPCLFQSAILHEIISVYPLSWIIANVLLYHSSPLNSVLLSSLLTLITEAFVAGADCRDQPYGDREANEKRCRYLSHWGTLSWQWNDYKEMPRHHVWKCHFISTLVFVFVFFHWFSNGFLSMSIIYSRLYEVSQRSVRGCGIAAQFYLNGLSVQLQKCSELLHFWSRECKC